MALSCRLCSGQDLRPFFSESRGDQVFSSYYCKECDLYQTLGDVPEISPDYISLEMADLGPQHIWLQTEHKITAFKQWLRIVRGHCRGNEDRSEKLLDVGCGVGGFLDFACRFGFQAYGFDASHAQVLAAQARHPDVRQATTVGDYVAHVGSAAQFGYVTLWDVFEHIREPVRTLDGIGSYLEPNGLLFLSVPSGTPNALKLQFASMIGRSPRLIPWEHVFYYTKRSLRAVLERTGFEVLQIGAVVPYLRPISFHEIVRRSAHYVLGPTPLALQIFAVARRSVRS